MRFIISPEVFTIGFMGMFIRESDWAVIRLENPGKSVILLPFICFREHVSPGFVRGCRLTTNGISDCLAAGNLQVDFIVFSTGIRPRDKLATQCGLAVAQRGGIMVNDSCQTSDPDIYAIGECASWNNRVYGLVAPGYKMAQVAVDHLLGSENSFTGADLSAKLKLLGVDVGGIGDAHGRTPGARSYVYLDESKEVYKRLIVSADNKTLLGAVLVGDTSDYGNLLQLVLNAIELPENPDSLILPAHAGSGKPSIGVDLYCCL